MNNVQHYAQQVVTAIGGKDNIKNIEHCVTRLRINVKDESLVNKSLIERIESAKGYFYQSGQHQIIFGTGLVDKVFDAIGIKASSQE